MTGAKAPTKTAAREQVRQIKHCLSRIESCLASDEPDDAAHEGGALTGLALALSTTLTRRADAARSS